MLLKRSFQLGLLVLSAVVGWFVIRLTIYALSEFIFCINTDDQYCGQCTAWATNSTTYIPKHIHQIFFFVTDRQLPKELLDAQRTWLTKNPDYKYTLWNASMIDALVEQKYPKLKALYHGYDHWVKRADVARYLVLHKYGGIYSDLDLWCKDSDSMKKILTLVGKKGVFLYWSKPTGVTNDFMASNAHHPFMTYLIRGLPAANRWFVIPYATTMFSTGPMFVTGRYYNYQRKEEIFVLPRANISQFIGRKKGSAWHRLDGKIIWWSFNHPFLLCGVILGILCTFLGIKMLFAKYRTQCNTDLRPPD